MHFPEPIYFLTFRLTHDIAVYGLFVLETVGTALATGDAMQWFSIGYGNMLALSKPWYSAMDAPVIDAVISLTVQLFFSWRIWVCTHLLIM